MKEACSLAFHGFGVKAAILLIPQIAFQIYVLWRHNQSIADAAPEIDPTKLYRRLDLSDTEDAALTDYQQLRVVTPEVGSERTATFNPRIRDKLKAKIRAKTESDAFAFRGLGLKAAILLIPQVAFKVCALWPNRLIAKVEPNDKPEQLHRHFDRAGIAAADMKDYLKVQALMRGVGPEQPATFNARTRDAWVKASADVPAGAKC